MPNVIFLDMDGVLCTQRANAALSSNQFWRHLDPLGTKMVEKLCIEHDAQLVLSSTWRISFDMHAMTVMLCVAGFADVPWHQNWKTPDMSRMGKTRGEEIAEWMTRHGKPDQYVILDDDPSMLPEQLSNFVQTDVNDGILWTHYEKADQILGTKK